jgi:uncharacterized repeat protein (TIGR01451 family)
VVDTGVWGSHPDLAAKMVDGWYRYDDGGGVIVSGPIPAGTNSDLLGHGTHVAGIAAASTNNGIGVAGVSWGAPIMPFRVFKSGSATDYEVSVAILWVADHGAKVINLSLGGTLYDSALAAAVAYAWDHGAVVVAAAGNSDGAAPMYPAAYPNVLGVANAGANDFTTNYPSGPGGYGSWVDLAAPGQGIFSTYNNGSYVLMSGTSMATPHAAGLAALIWSANPALTNAQVTYILTSTAEKVGPSAYDANGWNQYLGYGRINAAAATSAAPRIALAGPATADSLSLITYTLVLNSGNLAPVADVTITDALPAGASFVDASDGGVVVNGVVSWTLPTLSALETVTRLLTVTATHDLVNSDYGASSAAGVLAMGVAPVVTRVMGPVMAIAKSGPAWFEPGEPVTYTITVSNSGVQAASGLVVSDVLPAGAAFVAASDGGAEAGGVISWTVGGLAVGQPLTRTLTVSATQSLVNSAYGASCAEGATVVGSLTITSVAAYYHLYFPLWLESWP